MGQLSKLKSFWFCIPISMKRKITEQVFWPFNVIVFVPRLKLVQLIFIIFWKHFNSTKMHKIIHYQFFFGWLPLFFWGFLSLSRPWSSRLPVTWPRISPRFSVMRPRLPVMWPRNFPQLFASRCWSWFSFSGFSITGSWVPTLLFPARASWGWWTLCRGRRTTLVYCYLFEIFSL